VNVCPTGDNCCTKECFKLTEARPVHETSNNLKNQNLTSFRLSDRFRSLVFTLSSSPSSSLFFRLSFKQSTSKKKITSRNKMERPREPQKEPSHLLKQFPTIHLFIMVTNYSKHFTVEMKSMDCKRKERLQTGIVERRVHLGN
jgi:hypothetical protein